MKHFKSSDVKIMSKITVREINGRVVFCQQDLYSAYIFEHMNILHDSAYKSLKIKRGWNFEGKKIHELYVKTFEFSQNRIIYSVVIIHNRGY